jgi:Ca2+-binding RTX toxin-like protein
MRKVLAGAVVVALTLVAVPAAAQGAVVKATDNDWISYLDYEAGPAEANRVTVTYSLDPTGNRYIAVIDDPGAIIFTTTPPGESGTGCVVLGLHRATCQYLDNSVDSGNFALADRNDTFLARGAGEETGVDGGTGNDTLTGGAGDTSFEPGLGTDRVVGKAVAPHQTRVYYDDHPAPVSITVDGRANDGSPGENDSLVGIDAYGGSPGADTLIGSDGPDSLDSFGGADLIDGRGGDDRLAGTDGGAHLIGGAGHDTLWGGEGGRIDAADGEVDDVDCGGRYPTLDVDPIDVLKGCNGPGS